MARNKGANKSENKLDKNKKQKNKKTTPDDHATINEGTNSLESLTPKKSEENQDKTDIEKEQVRVHEASKMKKNKKRMLNDSDNVKKEIKSESSTSKKTCDRIDTKSEEDVAQTSEGTKNKRPKKSVNSTPVNNKNKTVVDETIAVPIKSKKQKHNLNPEEAAVTEEDIDKFCEELDEEDNVQYENWVKLIEANFKNSNKRKT